MKFRVQMKDPDTLYDAIRAAVIVELAKVEGVDETERESIADGREDKVRELCGKWFKWSEYLTVEIDTDAKTCLVVEVEK